MRLTPKQLDFIKLQLGLTPREIQILDLILQGVDSNEQIAGRLDVTLNTAKSYLTHLYIKLRVSSKLELAIKIIENLDSWTKNGYL